jgi:hypothetical protein
MQEINFTNHYYLQHVRKRSLVITRTLGCKHINLQHTVLELLHFLTWSIIYYFKQILLLYLGGKVRIKILKFLEHVLFKVLDVK